MPMKSSCILVDTAIIYAAAKLLQPAFDRLQAYLPTASTLGGKRLQGNRQELPMRSGRSSLLKWLRCYGYLMNFSNKKCSVMYRYIRNAQAAVLVVYPAHRNLGRLPHGVKQFLRKCSSMLREMRSIKHQASLVHSSR